MVVIFVYIKLTRFFFINYNIYIMVFILIKTSVRDNTSTVLNMNADKSQLLLYLDDIIQNTTESNDLIRYTKENGCIYEYSKKMGYIWSSRELNSVYSIIEYQKPE